MSDLIVSAEQMSRFAHCINLGRTSGQIRRQIRRNFNMDRSDGRLHLRRGHERGLGNQHDRHMQREANSGAVESAGDLAAFNRMSRIESYSWTTTT